MSIPRGIGEGQAVLPYPYNLAFQRQQPVVVLDDGTILAMLGTAPAAAELETAAGVRHGLARIGDIASVWTNLARRLRSQFEGLLLQELPARVAALRTDAVAYFVTLARSFSQRDFFECVPTAERQVTSACETDWHGEVSRAAQRIPAPEFERPSLWMLGRIWRLSSERAARSNCWRIHVNGRSYSLTGDFSFVATLAAQWRAAVERFVAEVSAHLATRGGEGDDALQVRLELVQRDYVERGDLVFVQGAPPWVGHILPAHYNRTLGRHVNRDLAIMAPLRLPLAPHPDRSVLQIRERSGSGWRCVSLPNGLCLGSDAPQHVQECAGIGLAAFLRWAAQRIASNGIFHTSDESSASHEDEQYS